MNMNNDENIVNDIKEGLDFIEQKITVDIPSLDHFRKMIIEVEKKKQKKAKREAAVFILTAVIALGIETYAFNKSILFFFILQGLAFSSFIIVLLNWLIRGYRKVRAI